MHVLNIALRCTYYPIINYTQDLIINLAKKVDNVTKAFKDFVHNMKTEYPTRNSSEGIKSECSNDSDVVNGVHVMRLPSRDAYSFALQLLDILFTREELASSLMFKSPKNKINARSLP